MFTLYTVSETEYVIMRVYYMPYQFDVLYVVFISSTV